MGGEHKIQASHSSSREVDLGFGDLTSRVGDHIGHFYRDLEEMIAVIVPYLRTGLEGEDRCLFICRREIGDKVLDALSAESITARTAIESGRLFVHQGKNSAADMVELFDRLIEESKQKGYGLIRNAGDMLWALQGMSSSEELMKWEAMYDQQVAPRFPFLALCQYDLRSVGGEVVLDALRTHPLCIVGELVHQNPFYTSPEEFLREIGSRPACYPDEDGNEPK